MKKTYGPYNQYAPYEDVVYRLTGYYAYQDNNATYPRFDVRCQEESIHRTFEAAHQRMLSLVAHNAVFDSRCLKEVFGCYRMDYPEFVFHDTLAASRRHFGKCLENHQLQTVAAACGYDLTNHHHALADAEACACIAIKIL